jgi:hypothetical protein
VPRSDFGGHLQDFQPELASLFFQGLWIGNKNFFEHKVSLFKKFCYCSGFSTWGAFWPGLVDEGIF